MAIYDFPKAEKNEAKASAPSQAGIDDEELPAAAEISGAPPAEASPRDQIFSAVAARLFFVLFLLPTSSGRFTT